MQKNLMIAICLAVIAVLIYLVMLPDRNANVSTVVNNVTLNVKTPGSSTGYIHKTTTIKTVATPEKPGDISVEQAAASNNGSTVQQVILSETVVTVPANQHVELALKYPRALFIGTPSRLGSKVIKTPGKSEPIFVPEGTELISTNKPVTSSDAAPVVGELSQITDGDKEGADGSFVELGPGRQFVQIDLQSEYRIYAIAVWHYFSMARVYDDVIILLSDKADFSTNSVVFNNDADNSSGIGKGNDDEYVETNKGLLVKCAGTRARYVRLYSNGSTASEMNHYVEVEVYGKP